ncbi:MAG: nucleotide pyrophosphohydrolase [Candidatus Thorarchaeota archaeon]
MNDSSTIIQQLKDSVEQFKIDRDWGQYHTPQDLAVSISIEAAELLEVFQWGIKEDIKPDRIEKIKEELADVMIYCISLANTMDIDIVTIIHDKIKLNSEKYPIEKAKGSTKKYTEIDS